MTRRLTAKDWRIIRVALNHAMDERDGFADAYSYKGPEADAAMLAVREFEALHQKLFGECSARQQLIERYAALPSAPITKLFAAGDALAPTKEDPA